jgi:hypothetical protein
LTTEPNRYIVFQSGFDERTDMTELPYKVGYGRPPVHTRFQKGTSGNPGGKPGSEPRRERSPRSLLREHFEIALGEALNADERTLRKVKPRTIIESIAFRLALDAAKGRSAARRQVVSILEGKAGPLSVSEGMESEPEERLIGADEFRALLGDRGDEFQTRFENALAEGSAEDLLALAEEFGDTGDGPEAGIGSGNASGKASGKIPEEMPRKEAQIFPEAGNS